MLSSLLCKLYHINIAFGFKMCYFTLISLLCASWRLLLGNLFTCKAPWRVSAWPVITPDSNYFKTQSILLFVQSLFYGILLSGTEHVSSFEGCFPFRRDNIASLLNTIMNLNLQRPLAKSSSWCKWFFHNYTVCNTNASSNNTLLHQTSSLTLLMMNDTC